MAVDRGADTAWQARVEQHQARAHYIMRADAQAKAAYETTAEAPAETSSSELAKIHGAKLATAFRTRSPREALAEYPELASTYATLAGAKAFADEKLAYSDRAAFVDNIREKVSNGPGSRPAPVGGKD